MKERHPLVSIIIPAYNAECYIEKSINSVLNQTYKNIQIIVIDDGSIDNTYSKVNILLKNHSMRKILKKENGGVSSARNLGIKHADGEYICFLDSDDYYDINFIQCMVEGITKHDLDLCYCGYKQDTDKTIKEYNYNYITNSINGNELCKLHLKKQTYLWTGSVIYKKSIILENDIIYPTDCQYGEDQQFIIKYLLKCNKVGCIQKSLVYYVYRFDSATYTFTEKRFTGIYAFENIKKYIKDNQILELLNKRIAQELYWISRSFANAKVMSKDIDTIMVKYKYLDYFKQYKNYLNYKEKKVVDLFINNPRLLYTIKSGENKLKKYIKNIINKK